MFYLLYRPEAQLYADSIILNLSKDYGYSDSEFVIENQMSEPGDLTESIRKHIKESSCVLLFVSKTRFSPLVKEHDWYLHSLKIALEERKTIIPIIFPDCGTKTLSCDPVKKELLKTLDATQTGKIQGLRSVSYCAENLPDTFRKVHALIEKSGALDKKELFSSIMFVVTYIALTALLCLSIGFAIGYFGGDGSRLYPIMQERCYNDESRFYFRTNDKVLVYDTLNHAILSPISFFELPQAEHTFESSYLASNLKLKKESKTPWYLSVFVGAGSEKLGRMLISDSKTFARALRSSNPKSKALVIGGAVVIVIVSNLGAGPAAEWGEDLRRRQTEAKLFEKLESDCLEWEKWVKSYNRFYKIQELDAPSNINKVKLDSLINELKNKPNNTNNGHNLYKSPLRPGLSVHGQ